MRTASTVFLVSILLAQQAAAETALGGASDIQLPLVRLFLGLVLCVVVALLAALAFKRIKGDGRIPSFGSFLRSTSNAVEPQVRVCESQRLSPQVELVRLNWAGSDYLVVITAGAASVVDKRAVANEASPS